MQEIENETLHNVSKPQFALIDIEGLIFDIEALVLALCRSEAGIKVPQSSLAEFQGCHFWKIAKSVLTCITPESESSQSLQCILEKIDQKARSLSSLLRPYFGAPAFIKYISTQLKLEPIFVTANPNLFMSVLAPSQFSVFSLFHFADPQWKPPVDIAPESLLPFPPVATLDISFRPVTSLSPQNSSGQPTESCLYLIGKRQVLNQLPSIRVLLHSQVLFFKSSRLLSSLAQLCQESLHSLCK